MRKNVCPNAEAGAFRWYEEKRNVAEAGAILPNQPEKAGQFSCDSQATSEGLNTRFSSKNKTRAGNLQATKSSAGSCGCPGT